MSPKISNDTKQVRRDAILDAAKKCFSRNGFTNTTIDDIVKMSGISKGAIYNYYPSKDELYTSMIMRETSETLKILTDDFAKFSTAKEKIHHIISLNLESDFLERKWNSIMHFEFWLYASSIPRLHQLVMENRCNNFIAIVANVIEEGKATGEFGAGVDSRMVASLFWAMYDGLQLRDLVNKNNSLLSAEIQAAEQLIFNMLQP